MTGHRLTWRPSFDSASAHWASVEASPDLTAVHVLLCRRLSTRHADVGRYRWQRDGKWRMIATSQRRPRRRRRGVLRLQHQHHFTSPTARRCVCQAVCGQVDGLSFFCAGQSGAKNNVSRHRAIAHIAGGWYGVVRCDRPPPVEPPPPVQGGAHTTHRGAVHCQLWRRHGASQLSPGLPREMRWPLAPPPVRPHYPLLLPCVDTDRRLAVIRFMVILIALSIAQFLTLAATVSPSDTHI
jgi:hypothetical protein